MRFVDAVRGCGSWMRFVDAVRVSRETLTLNPKPQTLNPSLSPPQPLNSKAFIASNNRNPPSQMLRRLCRNPKLPADETRETCEKKPETPHAKKTPCEKNPKLPADETHVSPKKAAHVSRNSRQMRHGRGDGAFDNLTRET